MANAVKHRRDFRQSRTHVLVKGIGSEGTGASLQLVYAEYTLHAADYLCRYLPDGWGGEPITSAEIDTVAKAVEAATAIGERTWGALGSLEWQTDGIAVGGIALTHFHQGDLVEVYDPTEGQLNAVFPLRTVDRVAGTTGHPIYLLTVGDVQPDIIDILRGITVINPIQAQLRGGKGGGGDAGGTGLGTSGQPGTPKQIPPTNTPTHSARNVVRGQGATTAGFTTRTPFVDPADPTPTSYAPQLGSQYWDATSGTWKYGFHTTGLDGWPHPNAVHLGGFVTDGTFPGTFATYPLLITAVDVEGGPGSVTLNKDSGSGPTAVAGPFTVGHHVLSPPIAYNPRVGGTAADLMSVTWTGTSATPSYCVVWEA